ncbi:MAG: hypothetical protein JRJ08_03920, partial [Deltaproteobacteria bacterium]|nr:hypothetical protein [Deltaproteobacteria bacterium]
MKKFLFTLGCIICLLVETGGRFWVYGGENISIVMVAPFQIHSHESLDYLSKALPH